MKVLVLTSSEDNEPMIFIPQNIIKIYPIKYGSMICCVDSSCEAVKEGYKEIINELEEC